jgi:hypothetical protein
MAYTTIDNPELYFQTKLYTGTGTSTAFTLDGSENMQPDAVWIKQRAGTTNHKIFDSVRGVQKALQPNDVDAEATESNGLTAFGSDGFTLGDHGDLNASSASQVAWCWKESATAGFDIIQFTGNATARTISHSLSAVPHVILMKNLANGDAQWVVYHVSTGNTQALYLNTTAVPTDVAGFFNDTTPTSSVFTVGTDTAVNGNTNSQICYAWSEKQGFSKFGSYTGNGNADGTFIYTGFKPAYVLVKRTDSTSQWGASDNKRNGFNPQTPPLYLEANEVENASFYPFDFVSNGCKLRTTSASVNASGGTFIYMAFAEAPFVNSNGVPCNAR